ncbi:methylthioribose kinase [Bacillaceae bacterium SIJ1]|uniref:DUF7147 family protein n=1 Tax=Litoribacterium kuwaitense TaxID=1398745 RepID=UPI0013EB90A6|nr:methylthioribose kinase [Litoribacterium kuwaitense]NGP44362.1 methylthioribose kinase [Litoribacterium kuwaitense]
MNYKVIHLGEGYNDVYELLEVARTNRQRLRHFLTLTATTPEESNPYYSLAMILAPASGARFQPVYICREGIRSLSSKRFADFKRLAEDLGLPTIELEVKKSDAFYDLAQYDAYLLGALKVNRMLETDQLAWS